MPWTLTKISRPGRNAPYHKWLSVKGWTLCWLCHSGLRLAVFSCWSGISQHNVMGSGLGVSTENQSNNLKFSVSNQYSHKFHAFSDQCWWAQSSSQGKARRIYSARAQFFGKWGGLNCNKMKDYWLWKQAIIKSNPSFWENLSMHQLFQG